MNTLTIKRHNIELRTSFLSPRTADLAKRGASDLKSWKYDPRPPMTPLGDGLAVLCYYGNSP